MAKYKPYTQDQVFLIPFDVNINIPEGTFIRFLNDFFDKHMYVDHVTLSRFLTLYKEEITEIFTRTLIKKTVEI